MWLVVCLHLYISSVCWDSYTGLCAYIAQWEKQMVRSSNFITIQGLTPNKTYYIRVLAFTSVGDGPLSQDLQIIAKTGGKDREFREECEDLRDMQESKQLQKKRVEYFIIDSLMLFSLGCSSIPTFRI